MLFIYFLWNSFRLHFHFFSLFLLRLICWMQSDDSNDTTCVRSKSDCVRAQGFCCVSFVCVLLFFLSFLSLHGHLYFSLIGHDRCHGRSTLYATLRALDYVVCVCVCVNDAAFSFTLHFIFFMGDPLRCIRISSFLLSSFFIFLFYKWLHFYDWKWSCSHYKMDNQPNPPTTNTIY